jgi:hypothetical protein
MKNVSLLNGRVGFVASAALVALAFATPAAAADLYTEPPPPAAYGPPPAYAAPPPAFAALGYVEEEYVPVPPAPVPVYRPYAVGAPYWYGRPYWRGYWGGPRYAGWYGRPWGYRY